MLYNENTGKAVFLNTWIRAPQREMRRVHLFYVFNKMSGYLPLLTFFPSLLSPRFITILSPMGHVRRHIPNLLRKHRKQWGYQQKEVAEMLGLKSTNRLSRWEKGTAVPNVQNLLKLGIIYGTLCDQLYLNLVINLRREISRKREEVLKKRKRKAG